MTLAKWHHSNRAQLADLLPEAIVVLPVGATEQHGPHLATGTDWILADAVAQQAAALVHERSVRPIVFAPPMPFGASDHHLPFGGTLSLSPETLLAVLLDLARSLHADGGRRLVLVNGHGGNVGVCHAAAAAASTRYGVNVAHINYWELLPPQRPAAEPGAVEGGAVEAGAVEAGAVEPGAVEAGAAEPGAAEPGAVVEAGAAEAGAVVEAGAVEGGAVERRGAGGGVEGSGDVMVPGHAGRFETALMLAQDEAFVAERKERLDPPTGPAVDDVALHTAGSWQRIDGYTDRPDLADAANGREWFDQLTAALGDRLLELAEVL
ncbi:MAG TPA: creatininase family protein [Kribbella sp.]